MSKVNNDSKTSKVLQKKRPKISQKDFPRFTLEKSLVIAKAIFNDFAAKGGAPHEIALAIKLAPTSGGWRNLCGASIAYGLTDGGYGANEITLLDLGRRIVDPEKEGDDIKARVEALLQPRIIREFFEKYNKAKFPSSQIAETILISLGLPKDRTTLALQILNDNGAFAGILKETKTGLFVALDRPSPKPAKPENHEETSVERNHDVKSDSELEDIARKISGEKPQKPDVPKEETNRVFISHGKSKKIVEQLKELLTFGKFDPIVSVERETTSIPVPEKVFQDMRSCSAGLIHVMSEGELLDSEGNKHIHINQNVLIEIGAAIALYGKRVILLVQKGVKPPSNLQGLYRCEYEGEALDYEATMKLLKTFNEFRTQNK